MTGSEGRFPQSLIEFQGRFATESACAEYLFARRWPEGFVCPGCGDGRAWLLKAKAFTYECAACGRQTSVTAGTIMHASKLPLTRWFWAAFLMATHSNGISALQLASVHYWDTDIRDLGHSKNDGRGSYAAIASGSVFRGRRPSAS
jgi:predicted RNA-binding Zn-ribbon protein involved in translation (DUF1610 family)